MQSSKFSPESFEHQWARAKEAALKRPQSGFETLTKFAKVDDETGFKNLVEATEKADVLSDAESATVGEALEKFMNGDGTQNEAPIGNLIPKEKTEIIDQLRVSGRYNIKIVRVSKSDAQTSSSDESITQLIAALNTALSEVGKESEPDKPEKTPSMYCNNTYCFTAGCTDPSHTA